MKVSRMLSKILRHSADKQQIPMDANGFVKVTDLLKLSQFNKTTVEDIQWIVQNDAKKRFTLVEGEQMAIRANQGHSIARLEVEMTQITLENIAELLPGDGVVIHGTFKDKLDSILANGLDRMKRQHIHFAISLANSVATGIRRNCNVLIYVDLRKCLADGIEFYLSSNNVVLTRGPIASKYFQQIKPNV